MNNVLLEVKDLETSLKINNEWLATVENISFELSKGEVLGIVGESGCGKSILSKSIIKLLPEKISKLSNGEVIFDGKRIDTLNEKQLLDIRGNDIAMIFQEPMTALNPVFTIKNQLVESIKSHKKISKKEANNLAKDLLKKVGIARQDEILNSYPHQSKHFTLISADLQIDVTKNWIFVIINLLKCMFVKTSLYGVIYTKMNIRRYKNGKYFRSKSSKKILQN